MNPNNTEKAEMTNKGIEILIQDNDENAERTSKEKSLDNATQGTTKGLLRENHWTKQRRERHKDKQEKILGQQRMDKQR